MKDDAQVRQDVLRELQWDGRVDDADIRVEVDGAVATLTGRVSTYASRHAAQAAAHRVFGVLDVVNNLEVQVPGSVARNDTDIAHAVRHALEWDVRVPDEREAIVGAARHTPGVTTVTDHLRDAPTH